MGSVLSRLPLHHPGLQRRPPSFDHNDARPVPPPSSDDQSDALNVCWDGGGRGRRRRHRHRFPPTTNDDDFIAEAFPTTLLADDIIRRVAPPPPTSSSVDALVAPLTSSPDNEIVSLSADVAEAPLLPRPVAPPFLDVELAPPPFDAEVSHAVPALPRFSADISQSVPALPPFAVHPRWFRLIAAFPGLAVVFAPDKWKPPARWRILCTEPGPGMSRHDCYGDPFHPRRHIPVPVSVYEARLKEREKQPLPLPPIVMHELDMIMAAIHRDIKCYDWKLPDYMIINFVEAIEEAKQYFQLKKHLWETRALSEFILEKGDRYEESLLEREVLRLNSLEEFNKVDKMAILHALKEHISNFISQHQVDQNIKYLQYLMMGSNIDWKISSSARDCQMSNMYPDLEERILENGFRWCRSFMLLCGPTEKEKMSCIADVIDKINAKQSRRLKTTMEDDKLLATRPVYKLVNTILQQQQKEPYVMDPDPGVEIQRSVLYDDWFSYHFMKDAPMETLLCQARTLIVRNVSPYASEEDVKQLFSCPEIQSVVMCRDPLSQTALSRTTPSQTAYVVFRDFGGLRTALIRQVSDRRVLDLPVIIRPRFGYLLRRAVAQTKAAGRMNSFVERAKYNEALRKYALLREMC